MDQTPRREIVGQRRKGDYDFHAVVLPAGNTFTWQIERLFPGGSGGGAVVDSGIAPSLEEARRIAQEALERLLAKDP